MYLGAGESLIVGLFKKGDKEDTGNYRDITLLNLVGKLYSIVSNNHLLRYLELNNKLREGQGGFRLGRSCIDNIFSLNEKILSNIFYYKNIILYIIIYYYKNIIFA